RIVLDINKRKFPLCGWKYSFLVDKIIFIALLKNDVKCNVIDFLCRNLYNVRAKGVSISPPHITVAALFDVRYINIVISQRQILLIGSVDMPCKNSKRLLPRYFVSPYC